MSDNTCHKTFFIGSRYHHVYILYQHTIILTIDK